MKTKRKIPAFILPCRVRVVPVQQATKATGTEHRAQSKEHGSQSTEHDPQSETERGKAKERNTSETQQNDT